MDQYNDQALADPLEGVQYGRTTAKFWSNSGKFPFIYSMAHGGCHYYLQSIASVFEGNAEIKLVNGDKPKIVDQCEIVLQGQDDLYEYCETIVRVVTSKNGLKKEQKKIMAVDSLHLTELIMRLAHIKKQNSKGEWRPSNLPVDYANTLLARKNWGPSQDGWRDICTDTTRRWQYFRKYRL